MQCGEFEARWHELLDERRSPESDSEIEEHLRHCPACRQLAAAQEAVLAGLAQAASPAAPDDLAERVLAELRRPVVLRFTARRRWLACAAAAVVVAVVVPWHRIVDLVTVPGEAQQPLAVQIAPSSDAPELGKLAAEAALPYRRLVRDTGDSLATALQIVPGVGGETDASDTPRGDPPPRADWVDGLSDGLAPVRKSTTGTLNSFLRVITAVEQRPRS